MLHNGRVRVAPSLEQTELDSIYAALVAEQELAESGGPLPPATEIPEVTPSPDEPLAGVPVAELQAHHLLLERLPDDDDTCGELMDWCRAVKRVALRRHGSA